jgi:hypothetical protein
VSEQLTSVELAQGIIDDLIQMNQLSAADPQRALEEADAWLQFPHASGRGHRLAGPRTRDCLTRLTSRSLASHGLEGRVDFDGSFKFLMKEFAERFAHEPDAIDESSVAELLSATATHMRSQLADWEVYIPVRFTFQTGKIEVPLGDVQLLPRKLLGRQLRFVIRAYLNDNDHEERSWRRLQARQALEHFLSYKWAAKVQLRGCDEKTAIPAAKEALLSGIDCLHVVFGRRASSRLRMADLTVSFAQSATALRQSGGDLRVWTSRGTLDVLSLPDDWPTWMDQPEVKSLLGLSGVALEAKTRFHDDRSLAMRYLDCARWFGEAVRDDAPFSKVVKYITAIERALVAGARRSIKRTVASRVSNLLYSTLEGIDWQRTYDDVLAAYALRSDLVHGSVSPFSDAVAAGVCNCGDLAENTLRVLLFRLTDDGLLASNVTEREYTDWFDRAGQYVEALRQREEGPPS